MFDEVKLLTHSSIKISGTKTAYFDPYDMTEELHDADLIFVTHKHYDHYSPKDIGKAANKDTWIVMPESMKGKADSMA